MLLAIYYNSQEESTKVDIVPSEQYLNDLHGLDNIQFLEVFHHNEIKRSVKYVEQLLEKVGMSVQEQVSIMVDNGDEDLDLVFRILGEFIFSCGICDISTRFDKNL